MTARFRIIVKVNDIITLISKAINEKFKSVSS